MWKILLTEKHDKMLIVWKKIFNLQIHDDVQVSYMEFK